MCDFRPSRRTEHQTEAFPRSGRALKESMWQRAVDGGTSAAEVLFYLADRAPGCWQDLKRIRHEVQHGGRVLLVPRSTPDDEREWGEAGPPAAEAA